MKINIVATPQYPEHPDIPVPPQPPNNGRLYGRVLHDFEYFPPVLNRNGTVNHWISRPEHLGKPLTVRGLPETVKAKDSRPIPLPEDWQWFSFALMWNANPHLTRSEAVALFRTAMRGNGFKTNQTAPPQKPFANFVTGEYINEEPMRTEVIFTGGAGVELLGEERAGGIDCWVVSCLDIHKPVPMVTDFFADGIRQEPHVYFATTSNRGNLGTLVIPLTGGPHVAIPAISWDGTALIEKARITVVGDFSNFQMFPYFR